MAQKFCTKIGAVSARCHTTLLQKGRILLFYLLEKFREMIRSKVNFEMLFLVDEIFKQRGKTFTLYIGKPVGWQTFDNTKTPRQWAQTVKEMVYKLPENE